MTSRKKPGVPFWATVALVAVVGYAASMPIALTVSDQPWMPRWIRSAVAVIYGPLLNLLLWLSGDTLRNVRSNSPTM